MKYPKVWGGPSPVGEALVRGLQMTGQPFLSAETADGTWAGAMNGFYEVKGGPIAPTRFVFEPRELVPLAVTTNLYPDRRFFGRPFATESGQINAPLGTENGDDPVWGLSVGEAAYRRRRGFSRDYGMRNWIRRGTIISWKGFSSRYMPEVPFLRFHLKQPHWGDYDTSYSLSDTIPALWFELEEYFLGWGRESLRSTKVFQKFGVILDTATRDDMTGFVCGAAKYVDESGNADLVVVTVEGFLSPTFRAYRVALLGAGSAELLHSESPGLGYTMASDWYFNDVGEEACCTIHTYDMGGDTLNDLGDWSGTVKAAYSIEGGFSFHEVFAVGSIESSTREVWTAERFPTADAHWTGAIPASHTRTLTTTVPAFSVPVSWDYQGAALCELQLKSEELIRTEAFSQSSQWEEDVEYNSFPSNPFRPKYDPVSGASSFYVSNSASTHTTKLVLVGPGEEIELVVAESRPTRAYGVSDIPASFDSGVASYSSDITAAGRVLVFCSIRDAVLMAREFGSSREFFGAGSLVALNTPGQVVSGAGVTESRDVLAVVDSGVENGLFDRSTEAVISSTSEEFLYVNTSIPDDKDETVTSSVVPFVSVTPFSWSRYLLAGGTYSISAAKHKGVVLASFSEYAGSPVEYVSVTFLSRFGDVRENLLGRSDEKFVLHNIALV